MGVSVSVSGIPGQMDCTTAAPSHSCGPSYENLVVQGEVPITHHQQSYLYTGMDGSFSMFLTVHLVLVVGSECICSYRRVLRRHLGRSFVGLICNCLGK